MIEAMTETDRVEVLRLVSPYQTSPLLRLEEIALDVEGGIVIHNGTL